MTKKLEMIELNEGIEEDDNIIPEMTKITSCPRENRFVWKFNKDIEE